MNRPQLLIDLGNTRLKWAVLAPDGALKAGAAIAHTEDGFGELAPLLEAGAECAAAWVSSTALSLSDALLLTLGGMLLVKLPVLLLGARWFGLDGIWASEAVSELILCVVALLMLRYTQARVVLVPASPAPVDEMSTGNPLNIA